MSTTSSCQSHHHQAVGKCERSGMREFTAEKTLGRKTLNSRLKRLPGAKPCVFSGKVAVRGRRWRVSVSAGALLDPESGRQNVNETVARACESSISQTYREKCLFLHSWRWGRHHVHETVEQARFHIEIVRNWQHRATFWRWGWPWGRQSVCAAAARASFHLSTTSSSNSWSQKNRQKTPSLCTFWRWGLQNVHETVEQARFHIKIAKQIWHRTTFWRWGRQNVHETVERARFHIEIVRNWQLRATFWRWGWPWGRQSVCAAAARASFHLSTTSSSSSWSQKNRQKTPSLCVFWRWGLQNVHETVARARFHIKIAKQIWHRTTFWRWGRQNVHETVEQARFHIEIWQRRATFWRWGWPWGRQSVCAAAARASFHLSTTSSSSSWSQKNRQKTPSLCVFWRWGLQNVHETVARARFHIKIAKQIWHRTTFWRWGRPWGRQSVCADVARASCHLSTTSSSSSWSHQNRQQLMFFFRTFWRWGRQIIHVKSFVSVHSFQFVLVNSLIWIHSFHSLSSIHSFQFLHFKSVMSIMSLHSFQFIHVNSFISCISCRFNSLFPTHHESYKPCPFFETSGPARAGHYLVLYIYIFWYNKFWFDLHVLTAQRAQVPMHGNAPQERRGHYTGQLQYKIVAQIISNTCIIVCIIFCIIVCVAWSIRI